MAQAHKGSQETYEYISKWIAPDFFFSKNDVWHRMGILGVFGDYVLSCTPGSILEIGVGESSIYLTALAKKYNRMIYHCDVAASKILNPLTVSGYLSDDHSYGTPQKKPDEGAKCVLFAGASDEMFNMLTLTPIALAFIDGDHNFEQVKKDFYNVLPYVVENGYILLHDTYPQAESDLSENRCGTVYKMRQEIEHNKWEFDCITLPTGTAMGVGITIVRKKPKDLEYFNE